jgi:nitrate/nitrite transporter NarK
MFPTQVRYSGASMGYQLAGVIGGALAPIIATALLSRYDTSLVVSLYAVVVLAITILCVVIARETAKADLDSEDAAFHARVRRHPA